MMIKETIFLTIFFMEICRAKPSLHKIYLAEVGDNIEDAEPDRLETGDKEHLNEENQKREYLDYNEISKRLNQIRLSLLLISL